MWILGVQEPQADTKGKLYFVWDMLFLRWLLEIQVKMKELFNIWVWSLGKILRLDI